MEKKIQPRDYRGYIGATKGLSGIYCGYVGITEKKIEPIWITRIILGFV